MKKLYTRNDLKYLNISEISSEFLIKIEEKKYYLTTKNITTWQSARTECRKLGGDLATVGMRNNGIRM